ncbi:MAG: HAD-IIA family hydrolase, partial [Flavobacteriaceae bacterium]
KKISNAQCFLFDMDGTIYLGNNLLPGTKQFLSKLDQEKFPYYFLTNNSSLSRADYVDKFKKLGLKIPGGRIFSSGEATAIYIKKQNPGARLFLVGTPSLEGEFLRFGFKLVKNDPEYVVLGFDTTITYEKIRRLCDFVRAGRPYIATHPDINCPTEEGFIPDIGATIALVEASTGRTPDVIIGKPHPPIVEAIIEKTGFNPNEIVMVGDRLYTDIALGQAGLTTVLVLSGETKLGDIEGSPYKPDYVVSNISGLNDLYFS